MPASCRQKTSSACSSTNSVRVGVAVSAVGVVEGQRTGSPREAALAPVLWKSWLTLLDLMHHFHSSFSRELTDMTGNKSSIGMQTFPVVGSRDIALAALRLIPARWKT